MCGIWAIFGCDCDTSKFLPYSLRIRHRGPDAYSLQNVKQVPNCVLGFLWLAVTSDKFGMQPIRNPSKPHLWVIYNGEIYNYKKLGEEHGLNYETTSDGESILLLVDKYGPVKTASLLDGVFAFCVLDTKERKVYLGRDTYGVRPMFRLKTPNGQLGICSEAKGLIDAYREAYDEGGESAFIEQFPPGHVAEYDLDDANKLTMVGSTHFHRVGKTPLYSSVVMPHGADVEKNIRDLLEAAVKKRLMAHRRIGCLLSGGLDSTLVTGLVLKLAKEVGLDYNIQTFSVGMPGSTDLAASRKAAEYFKETYGNIDHHEVELQPEDFLQAVPDVIYHLESFDITTVRASVGMYLLSRYIKENTDSTVIFSGEGADEVCQGYIYFHRAPDPEAAHRESLRLQQELYVYDVTRADRTTAAWGLELRVPFLDHRFTSYYMSLPPKARVPIDGVEKHLLRSAFSGTGLIPDSVLWRAKEAFSDGVSSQRRSWHTLLQEHVEKRVSDDALDSAPDLYPDCTPHTKEAFYFRQVFESHFKGCSSFIPRFWMPRWTDTQDPSARTLAHYK